MKKRLLIILIFHLSFSFLWAQESDSTQTTKAVENAISQDQPQNNLMNELNTESESLSNFFKASKIISALIVLGITYLFLRILSFLLSAWAERNTKNRVLLKGLIPLLRIIIWISSILFIIIAIFKPPMASVLAFLASVGIAIGFAAQDLLKNIFGGLVIVFDKPFQVGDKIKIGEYYGEVTGIGLRSVRLVTSDDNLVSVPNAEIMNASVANANAGQDNCQVVTEIYLPLHSDISEVRKYAIEVAQVSNYVFLNKPIVVLFFQEKIGHKVMLKVSVKAYVNEIRNEFIFKSEITEMITKRFQADYENDLLNSDNLS